MNFELIILFKKNNCKYIKIQTNCKLKSKLIDRRLEKSNYMI